MTQDELSDWPDSDQENKFKRMPKHKRTKLVHGFHAGLESGSLREKGLFEKNTVDIYPEVKSMTITGSKNKDSLYTTGDLEHGSGISSPVIRGFTRDMRVPNLEGTNFDNMKVSKKYGKPYVPLTEKEKEDLMKNVWDSKYNYNKELDLLFAREQTEKDPETGIKGHLVRANRPVPVISGDDFDNMQSAGKSRKRSNRTRKTKHKRIHKKRSKRKTKKHSQRNKKRSSRKK